MCHLRSLFLFAIALIPCLVLSLAAQQETAGDLVRVPKGYLLIREDQWNLLADEPSRHVARARDAYLIMDTKNAAAELRKVAVHVRIAADHAADRSKRALLQSEHGLEQGARHIETGTLRSIEDLDMVTSQALHALADDQYGKATQAWRKRELRQAGQYLRASATNLECAAMRFDAGLRQATATIVEDSRSISEKLVEGTGVMMDDLGIGFESLGKAIERLGTQLEDTVRR